MYKYIEKETNFLVFHLNGAARAADKLKKILCRPEEATFLALKLSEHFYQFFSHPVTVKNVPRNLICRWAIFQKLSVFSKRQLNLDLVSNSERQ